MMMGTASLPHILMRYFTTPSVSDARKSVAWSLLFIFLLYFTAPALATFTKLQVLDPQLATSIIGKSISSVNALDWVQKWSNVGFLKIIDSNHDGILQINEFFMRPDIVVLATPEIAGLPAVISGLVAAGGLAAAMSTADGLLLAIANALSHDLYYKMIDPKAETRRRLIVARVLLLAIGAAGSAVAALRLTGILGAVAWAFDFAMSGLFFPLVLGVWWKRANGRGDCRHGRSDSASGPGTSTWCDWAGMTPWLGIDHLRFGIIGAAASLIAMVAVTLMTQGAGRGNAGHGRRESAYRRGKPSFRRHTEPKLLKPSRGEDHFAPAFFLLQSRPEFAKASAKACIRHFPFGSSSIDYILGMIMWTLIGRFGMGIFLRETSNFFFMRILRAHDGPADQAVRADHASVSDPAGRAALRGVVLLHDPLLPHAVAARIYGHGDALFPAGRRDCEWPEPAIRGPAEIGLRHRAGCLTRAIGANI